MVALDEIRRSAAAVVQSKPLVAVFFGGTSGIGHYTLRALARATANNGGKGFRAYIVGRKAQAAEEIISECEGICSQGEYRFVKANDISLIEDVDRVCAEIAAQEEKEGEGGRIDFLMLTQGGSIFLPRTDTKEGIDVTMSLLYYSRMRIITKLTPLLLKSINSATVISVYAAGMEGKLYSDDLSLRNPKHFSYSQSRSHMCYMHTLFLESMVQQHPGKLSLIHIFPGLVLGPGFNNPELPSWFRTIWRWIVVPVFGRWTVKPDNSGDLMLSLASGRYLPGGKSEAGSEGASVRATNGQAGGGAYSLKSNGESNYKAKAYKKIDKDGLRTKVWEHTNGAFEVIAAGNVFAK